ncbi:OmpA family protein [uncultured Boseongicola sp.]|uniref:OmpA family protein n=1 Tax=uncultured Boseongicola sp. TaxID=1648499 RepID=UPI0034351934
MDQQEAELRRELEGTGVRVYRNGDYIELIMPSNITFDTGSWQVKQDFRRTLHSVATVLNHYNRTYIYVDGHTDTVGSREYNQDLSERRAESVAQELIVRDVLAGRLIVRGFGETQPLIPTGDNVNEPQNRRVEIQIVPYTNDRNY